MRLKLKELGEVLTGNTPSKKNLEFWESQDICFVKPDIISDKGISYIRDSKEYIAEAARTKARIVGKDAIFVTCIGSIGKIGIAAPGEYAFNQQINVIIPNEKVISRYLAYNILFNRKKIITMANAAVVPILNKSQFEDLELDIEYDKQKQEKIVDVLERLEYVIDSRIQQLQLLDDLVKARFVEMFGDIKLNPNRYQMCKIGELLKSCEAGWSGNGTQRVKQENEVAVLKVSAVTKGYFMPDEYKVLDDQKNIKKYIFPEKGDLIFSRANTREMVGATAVITQDYPDLILPDKLWKIKFKEDVNVFYIKHVLSSKCIREQFSAASTGTSGSMYNVSMEKFKSIEIPVAPFFLQNQFATFVTQVNKSKAAIQKSLDETQLLFDSLMQEYFG